MVETEFSVVDGVLSHTVIPNTNKIQEKTVPKSHISEIVGLFFSEFKSLLSLKDKIK